MAAGAGDAEPFGDRLARRVADRASQLVVGLDPDPARLWPRALELAEAEPADTEPGARASRAVVEHCELVLDAVSEHCVAAKLQLACFERLGAHGWVALKEVADRAAAHGLMVIADGKRGDVAITAAAYAQALFGSTPTPYGLLEGLGVDAATVNPLLGVDSLQPFAAAARQHGAGLFVLVRTSNPGAADVQESPLDAGGTVSDRLAGIVAELGAAASGSSGLSDIGAVVGATAPQRLASLRERMPNAVFLLPGVGAQGGRVEDLAPVFLPGRAGGLLTASRAIVAAHERTGGDPAASAREEALRLRVAAWELRG